MRNEERGGRPDIYRELSMAALAALRVGDLAESEVLSRHSQQLFDASKRPATDGKAMSQHITRTLYRSLPPTKITLSQEFHCSLSFTSQIITHMCGDK